jgi:hypothetical protein
VTWVVGKATPWGYALGLSDVSVTFGDGTTLDCLQKIYPVAPNIAAGFAGSVRIGLTMVALLRRFLRLPPGAIGFDPVAVAAEFPQLARECFQSFDSMEQKRQSDLLLVSINPNESNGLFARSYVHKLCSPDYQLEAAPPRAVQSIGSGADEYVAALERMNQELHMLDGLELRTLSSQQGIGLDLLLSVSLSDEPKAGISPHMHICVVRPEGISIRPNDKRIHRPDGVVEDFRMPRVATSFDEFSDLVDGSTHAEGATC